ARTRMRDGKSKSGRDRPVDSIPAFLQGFHADIRRDRLDRHNSSMIEASKISLGRSGFYRLTVRAKCEYQDCAGNNLEAKSTNFHDVDFIPPLYVGLIYRFLEKKGVRCVSES